MSQGQCPITVSTPRRGGRLGGRLIKVTFCSHTAKMVRVLETNDFLGFFLDEVQFYYLRCFQSHIYMCQRLLVLNKYPCACPHFLAPLGLGRWPGLGWCTMGCGQKGCKASLLLGPALTSISYLPQLSLVLCQ